MSATNNEINELPVINQPSDNGNALQGCVNDILNNTTPKDYHTMLLPAEAKTGCLPSIALFDSQADLKSADTKGGDVPPPPEIPAARTSDKDLAKDGIKTAQSPEGTTHEFPNGIKVISHDNEKPVKDGNITTSRGPEVVVEPGHNYKLSEKDQQTVVDEKGKPVMKMNDDGTTTVYTEKGAYTVNGDGSVNKETAIKNRDGSWDVVNTKDPLGNMKAPDLAPVDAPKHRSH